MDRYRLDQYEICKTRSKHKGFYNCSDIDEALSEIKYEELLGKKLKKENLCWSAWLLLNGCCNIFATELRKALGYEVFIIEQINKKGFHVFCQACMDNDWYYIDVRGVTTNFDEFLKGIRMFIKSEFIVRKVTSKDIATWDEFNDEKDIAIELSQAIIRKYKNYYMIY
jgi:hypothetical protein